MNSNVLNILAMIVSLILATKIPFDLLIFSYAFLGPLHYLTEINWLEDKSFFARSKKWMWLFIPIALLLIIPPSVRALSSIDFFATALSGEGFNSFVSFLGNHYTSLLFIAIATGVALSFTAKWYYIIPTIIVASLIANYSLKVENFTFIFGVFLPTLIHVYVFTALFMLYGALRSKSSLGILSFFLLALVPVIIFNLDVEPTSFVVSEYMQNAMRDSNFSGLNQYFASFFGLTDTNQTYSLLSPVGLKIQMFIAFAYIYHYLNWFSKTSVIKWHKSFSKRRVYAIVIVYIIAIGLYIYDFRVGFIAMFFLSFLHVLLEFPLNVISVKGIGQELGKRFSGGK
jgi:hypothetical protein